MRIRMVADRTGPRWDGQDWPPYGGEITVPDDEGAALCEHGYAVPVVTDAAEVPEQPDPAAETRAAEAPGAAEMVPESPARDMPMPPRVNAPRADWAAHAVSRGADPDAVDELTKAALIAAYGKGPSFSAAAGAADGSGVASGT